MEYLDLTPPALRKELLCITTTRQARNMKSSANREKICEKLSIPSKSLTCGQQIHKDHLALITKTQVGKTIPETDTLLTPLSRVPLTVFTADCLPIFIWCPAPSPYPLPLGERKKVRGLIGLVHAGHRGTQLKILEKTLKFMANHSILEFLRKQGPTMKPRFRGESRNFLNQTILVFGPCICNKCYGFDLRSENRKQALQQGIRKENIYISPLCTSCHPELFFSYHRNHTPSRMMNVIMLMSK